MSAVVVLGAAGLVGRWARTHLAAAPGHVLAVDRVDAADGADGADGAGGTWLRADALDPCPRLLEAVATAPAVVVALPEHEALGCLEHLVPAAGPGTVLVPTCSVQVPVFARAEQLGAVQTVVGVDPLFQPTLDPAGRPVAVVARDGADAPDWLVGRLRAGGMTVTAMTPHEHDETLAYLQALPHAAVLAFATALADAPVDVDRLMAVAPPPAATLVALACRMLTSPVEVYRDVQRAEPGGAARRRDLAAALARLDRAVADPDDAAFDDLLSATATWLGPHLHPGARHCQALFDVKRPAP